MDFIQGHVRDVMTLLFFPPIRSNVTYSQKSGILGMYESMWEIELKPGFHIIAPVATIAAVVEKRVSATVAIYGNTLLSDSSGKYDGGDECR